MSATVLASREIDEDSASTSDSESPEALPSARANGRVLSRESSNCSDDPVQLELATARLLGNLEGAACEELSLEKDSVYGAVFLLPQLARSARWPKFLAVHAIRSFLFLFGNLLLQGWLLMAISKEQHIYDAFSGKMYLCDFGEGYKGPFGTVIDSPGRLYSSFSQWNTRVFVRDMLLATFPERADRIREEVDPGEYGMESRTTRAVCCLLFVMATIEEFYLIINMIRLIYSVPTKAEPWMALREPDGSAGGDKDVSEARVKIAGIPAFWKVLYAVLVICPKVILWKSTMQTGFTYIMDTAQISDLIVNAVALGFILTIDELICSIFFPEELKQLLQDCQGFPLPGSKSRTATRAGGVSDVSLLRKSRRERGIKAWRMSDLLHSLLPSRLAVAFIWFGFFTFEYYYRHCQWDATEGHFISRTRYYPESSQFSLPQFLLPNFFTAIGNQTVWKMRDQG